MPDAIRDAPELRQGLELFYEAFWELSSCRSVGMAMSQIPWLAINTYANHLEIYGEQRQDLYYHIRNMDEAYLVFNAPKDK